MAATAFWDISPARKGDTGKENYVPVLSLVQFSKVPFVSFGTVKIGTSKSALLRIENPNEDVDVEVTVEKIASGKGFSVDSKTFTVEGQGWFGLTVTWTPTEEGGVRELVMFNANRVVKHQAVILGRAEAPKKKKKTLWDTIKNKPAKVSGPGPKKAANKTFQVSRRPQYKRDRPRSPLVSLNRDGPNRGRVRSPLACLVPEMPLKQRNSQDFLTLPENKDLAKVLNKTLSPVGTPDRLKRLMPRIDPVESPLLRTPVSTESTLSNTPALSIKDALALINSDLSPINGSPRESANEFSDSLESKSGELDAKRTPEVGEPRLTFFVSKKVVLQDVKPFTSTTVTKSKAPVETGAQGRKTIKSRRRLLERTLELSDSGSQAESRSGTPCLPVIDVDADSQSANGNGESDEGVDDGRKSSNGRPVYGSPAPITFLVTTPQVGEGHISPTRTLHEQSVSFSFPVMEPPKDVVSPVRAVPSHCDAIQIVSSKPLAFLASSPESFPVHVAGKCKKRKSEEFLAADANAVDAGKSVQAKRCRGSKVKSEASEDKRAAMQRRQPRPAVGLQRKIWPPGNYNWRPLA
ncbi:uncharacterized protein [Eucyclogobius newberryi]|uniref:uncharacterized protein n=1 Tax=Eucyclogobius newberryi TaxID=166745 RepID=UPI003B599B6A